MSSPSTRNSAGGNHEHTQRVFGLILFVSGGAHADELYVYPAKGQSHDQEEQDKFQCYQFGKKQTGFDPMKAPTATSQEPESQGGAGGGALRGALLGVAIGAATMSTKIKTADKGK
jgi:hypothetical protein